MRAFVANIPGTIRTMDSNARPFGELATAMVTPFKADGSVDHEQGWRLAKFLVDSGSDGLVVAGTTGEAPTLSADERVALFATVVDAVGGRAQVIAGTSTYDTKESVELTRRAAAAGVDAILAVTPYYSKPEQTGLIAHFRAVAGASDLPVILYNIPGRSGRIIELDTLAKLAEVEQIVAVKDACLDVDFTSKTVARIPQLAVYSGQDSLTLPMLAVGACGVVSVISHLAGKAVKAMVQAANRGDLVEARRLHLQLLPLSFACFVESNPIPVKAGLNALWEPVGDPRLPLTPATDATLKAVTDAMAGLK